MPAFPPGGIETERLIIRVADQRFIDTLLAYRLANRAYLQPWEPLRDDAFFSAHASRERAAAMERDMKSGSALNLLLFSKHADEPMIGECNFTNIVRGPFQACHLGYSIDRRQQGRGLMQEALTAAIRFMFDEQKLHRVMASFRPENERSGQLLARLGFEREGLAKAYLKINGEWADHVLCALVNGRV